MSQSRAISERMKTILDLDSEPVGVFLLSGAQPLLPFQGFRHVTGQRMLADMPRLDAGSIVGLALAPLHLAPRLPDVVVVEGAAESLMWLLLADLNLKGGERRQASTAVLQATCVDATVIPFCERRLNFSLGCYGCREAADMAPGETVLGFPAAMLDGLLERLEELSQKAIPRSRAKQAFQHLQGEHVHAVMCDTKAGASDKLPANVIHDY